MAVRNEDLKTPVIALSGGNHGNGDDYLRMAKMLGASTILNKQLDEEILLTTAINYLLPFE